MSDYKELAVELVKRCVSRGASAAEVYLQERRNLSIEVRNGDTETIQESSSHGVGIRAFVKGRMAFAHCNELSPEALDDAVRRAISFAAVTTPDEHNILPEDTGITDVKEIYDPKILEIPMQQKIELALELEKQAMADSRITKSSGARYSESESKVLIASSSGINQDYTSMSCGLRVSVVAEKEEQKSSGSESCRRRFWSDLETPEEIGRKAAEKAYEMLDPRMVRTQKAAVIIHRDAAYSILGGILRAINGERVLQGASFLADKVGTAILPAHVTLIDDGIRSRGLASVPFDGEGVPTQKRTIVDAGVLSGYMYNTAAASRAGTESTGNATRRGFSSLPGIGAHAFYMADGSASPEEIIKSTRRGLLLKQVTGYGINPVSGNFSGGAAGFWIENGEIAFPVKGLTIAGKADEIFAAIDLVGNDLDLNRTMTAPTFRVASLQIGGE
jgi:PmbA protein